MAAARIKRFFLLVAFLVAAAGATAAVFAILLTRDVPFGWEQVNKVEAGFAERKLRFYDEAMRNGEKGYVRLSEVEINSYLATTLTNLPGTNADLVAKLRHVGISMNKTNLTLYSWGERRVAGLPARFVVLRGFDLRRSDAQRWEFPAHSMHVGDLEIPAKYWGWFEPTVADLDAPLREHFSWLTNVKAAVVTKNELSQRPELRLYNYNPFASRELH